LTGRRVRYIIIYRRSVYKIEMRGGAVARPAKSEALVDARGELIEAAWQLFSSAGYDATPVRAIIEKVGLSKGAFYYYFSGKEDILDAVVGRIADEIFLEIEPIPSMESLSPVEKLSRFIETISKWKLAHIDIIKETADIIYSDESAIIRHKMNKRVVKSFSPVLAEIISQGVEDRVFDVEYPSDTAEMIMRFSNAMSEMQADPFMRLGEDPLASELILRRARLYMVAIERILGAPRGSVFSIDRDLVEGFERALRERELRKDAERNTYPG
jgi:AcrR family transcriptional regulator